MQKFINPTQSLKSMTWTKPLYGKAKVDRAGHILMNKDSTEEAKEEALTILNNWRSSHGYPMNTFQARLRQMSKKVDDNALVVQRLKRVPSIIKKLKREQTKTMSLSQMQDIAGCRTVLSGVDKVNELTKIYQKSRGLKHKKVGEKNYIKNKQLNQMKVKKNGRSSLN